MRVPDEKVETRDEVGKTLSLVSTEETAAKGEGVWMYQVSKMFCLILGGPLYLLFWETAYSSIR